jgi:hypothetical protein
MYWGGRLITDLASCSCLSPGNFCAIDSLRRGPNDSLISGISTIFDSGVSSVRDRRVGARKRKASLSGATMGLKPGLVLFRGNAKFLQQLSPQQYFSKNFVPLPPSSKSLLISDLVQTNVVLALRLRSLEGFVASSGSLSKDSSAETSCGSVMGVEGASEVLSSSVVPLRLSALERVESVIAYLGWMRGESLLILCVMVGSVGIGLSGWLVALFGMGW